MKNRGFTLIELLVVISIIAILASILFPVFAQARERAKAAQCQSDHKQAAEAIIMYCNDNDDYLPLSDKFGFLPSAFGMPNSTLGQDAPWSWSIQAYVRNFDILACPCDANDDHYLDPMSTLAASRQRWGNNVPLCFHTNFGFNYQWLSYASGATPDKLVWVVAQASSVGAPANTVLFIDTAFWRDSSGSPIGGGSFVVDAPFAPPGMPMNKPVMRTQGTDFSPQNWLCYLDAYGDQSKDACSSNGSAYGKAYPFHPMGSGFTVAYLDGHVKKVSAGNLVSGWSYRTDSSGADTDWDLFPWDTF